MPASIDGVGEESNVRSRDDAMVNTIIENLTIESYRSKNISYFS